MINLGRSFHLQVIAEGVETRDPFPLCKLKIVRKDRATTFRMQMASNASIIGKFTISRRSRVVGWIATLIMGAASLGLSFH